MGFEFQETIRYTPYIFRMLHIDPMIDIENLHTSHRQIIYMPYKKYIKEIKNDILEDQTLPCYISGQMYLSYCRLDPFYLRMHTVLANE